MVTGYARWLAARLIPSRAAEDLFAGWWQLLAQLGAVPRVLVWDGEGAVGQRRRRQTVLTEQTHAFRGVLGAKVVICDPGDPEAKGLVERANGYLETSFLPGRTLHLARRTSTPSWPTGWRWSTSGSAGCWAARPADRIDADRAAMLRAAAGRAGDRLAQLAAAAARPLRAAGQQRLLGPPGGDRPPRRGRRRPGPGRGWPATGGWSPTMGAAGPATRPSATPPTWPAAAQLRRDRAAVGAAGRRDQDEVELRCLADYDAAFGLDTEGVA